ICIYKFMFLYFLGLVVLFLVFRWIRELPRVSDKGSKYVYITGCDSGFGNLLARHLDKLGFPVIAGCYTEKGEEELRKACSGNLTTTHLDVTSKESVAKVAAMIKQKVGHHGLWAVVNNAGVAVPSGPCDWHVVDDYKFMVNVNLHGVIAVTLSVLPLIKKAGGRVVNVASVFGRISVTGGPYPVSKFAVEGFNDSLRIGMAPFGVKVLLIEPGFFKTNVTDSKIQIESVKGLWERLPQEMKDDYGSDYLDKAIKVTSESLSKMSDRDLMKVVNCMEHAVAAVWPRKRYSPGWDAKFFWLPMSYMPTCIVDYIVLRGAIPVKRQKK
uniref:Dehydrogenase/reductase (SDR family) member 9 n=1 Tax=Oryzias latipes TaxID=8090 RepID=A0A3P9JMV4_ORYLA